MDDVGNIRDYWSKNALSHIAPRRVDPSLGDLPEGKAVLAELVALTHDKRVLDYGCGYGRLAHLFLPHLYNGVDVCEEALEHARINFPDHTFTNKETWIDDSLWNNIVSGHDLVLFYTVLVHYPDDAIRQFAKETRGAKEVLIAEVMNPAYSRPSAVPPTFNRTVEDYRELFSEYRQDSYWVSIPYEGYRGNSAAPNALMTLLKLC